MSNKQLVKALQDCRDTILSVELACLLHDLGKCASSFTQYMLESPQTKYNHRNILQIDETLLDRNDLRDFFEKPLATIFLNSTPSNCLPNEWDLNQISIKDFIEKHEKTEPKTKLIAFIQIADKKDATDDRNMPLLKQDKETYISSIFGKEKRAEELDKARDDFYKKLFSIWKNYKTQKDMQKLRKEVYDAFDELKNALAETRRAANDVSLVDHAYATAAIMKALLCWDVLENFSKPFQSLLPTYRHWKTKLRILGIGWNTKKLFAETQSLSGIAGRELLVDRVIQYLENFLEYEIPIGNIIYKDQNTICFLVPENIHIIFNELKEQIIRNVDALTDGILIPAVELSESSPYPNKVVTKTIEKLREKNTTPIQERFTPTWVNRWSKTTSSEICRQCGKRPIMRDEELCEFCIELIKEGAGDIARKTIVTPSVYNETVWIDEIADKNRNVALIYGLLPLEKWLDGTLLRSLRIKTIQDIRKVNQKKLIEKLTDRREVQEFFGDYYRLIKTIQEFEELLKNNCIEDAAKLLQPFLEFKPRKKELLQDTYMGLYSRAEPQTPAGVLEVMMTKPPSPSRIRKIWKETQKFFQELSTITQDSVYSEIGDYCYRLKFKLKFLNKEEEQLLKSIKSPILEVDKFDSEIKLPKSDLFWDGIHAYTTIRLEHYAPSNDKEEKSREALLKEKQEYIKRVIEKLQASSKPFVTIKDKRNKREKIELAIESYSFEKYIPVRTILASPNLFVTIVPAELALSIIQKGYVPKYQECFGKVADRLPLNIGILFFKRKFPLYIAMDVMAKLADNLLSLSSERRAFKVAERNASELVLEEDNKDKQKLLCTKEDNWLVKYRWEIDAKLGDGSEDLYYPNFIVVADNPDVKKKETYFELGSLGSTLNVKDIEKDMSLQIYPSLFDFHFLGATSERFHLFSDNKKRQHPILGAFGMRPYLLKDIEKMNELWDIISPKKGKLTTSQIKKLEYACITKIEEWFRAGQNLTANPATEETYRKFVDSSINNICKSRLSPDERNKLKEAVLSGMFFDVVELFLTLKSYNK